MRNFIRKSSKFNLIYFYIYVERFFIIFARRPWYRKKRFIIPICLFMAMLIGGAIIGVTLGLRSAAKNKGRIFFPRL